MKRQLNNGESRVEVTRQIYEGLITPKTALIFGCVLLIILYVALRFVSRGYVSGDASNFLMPWFNDFSEHGFSAITTTNSNYNVPYLYLLFLATKLPLPTLFAIKSITFMFEILFIFVVYKILRRKFVPEKALFASLAISFLPNILLNGAVWAQCDIIYTTFLLASWWKITQNRQGLAWIFFGLAIAFKLQAIFFLPILIYFYFAKNCIVRPIFSRKNLVLLSPVLSILVFFITTIPALFAGRSLIGIINIYIGQTSEQSTQMTASAANVWQLIGANPIELSRFAVIFTMVILAIILIAFFARAHKTNLQENLYLPLLILLIIPFFLPFMHERYLFAAEIFAMIFAVYYTDRILILTAVLLQLTSFIAYSPFLFHADPAKPMLTLAHAAIINGLAITLLAYHLFRGNGSLLKLNNKVK